MEVGHLEVSIELQQSWMVVHVLIDFRSADRWSKAVSRHVEELLHDLNHNQSINVLTIILIDELIANGVENRLDKGLLSSQISVPCSINPSIRYIN